MVVAGLHYCGDDLRERADFAPTKWIVFAGRQGDPTQVIRGGLCALQLKRVSKNVAAICDFQLL